MLLRRSLHRIRLAPALGSVWSTSQAVQPTSLLTWYDAFHDTESSFHQAPCPSSRWVHTSSRQAALGVVDLLHDEIAIALPAGSSRRFWEVVEFRPDGTTLETWKTPEVLGLHPRDIHLFTSDAGAGQRAMLAPRSGAILFRTEVAKAVVYSDKAVLFPSRRLQDTVRVAQAIKSALSQRSALPFELKVLESLLSETAQAFDRKTKRLGMVAETVLEDINRNFHASAAELQRSLPIARKLTEVQHDVKETLDAIGEVANYDTELQALCLTERAKAISAMTSSGKAGGGAAGTKGAASAATAAAAAAVGDYVDPISNGGGAVEGAAASHPGPTRTQKKSRFERSGAGSGNGFKSGGIEGTSSAPYETHTSQESGGVGGGGSASGDSFNGSLRGTSINSFEAWPGLSMVDHSKNPQSDRAPGGGGGASAWHPGGSGAIASPSSNAAARSVHMRMASRILEAYEFRLLGTHSALNELLENMDQTRTVWHMQLDHQRNRVLRVNLLISTASLGGLIGTMPAAYFGMNLDSGLDDLPGLFWPVVQGSVATGILISGLIYTYYKFGPKRRYAARLRDMRSLRDLLSYHMDDLDAITDAVRAKGRLTKKEFTELVGEAVRGKPMSNEEIALLFRVFDANKDAVLELSELMKLEDMQETFQDQLSHHTS